MRMCILLTCICFNAPHIRDSSYFFILLLQAVELLLTHNANALAKNNKGKTAWTLATNRGHGNIAAILKDRMDHLLQVSK